MILFSTMKLSAQKSGYSTAIGGKFYPGAVTFKQFIKDDAALEFLGSFWVTAFRVTGLYEVHKDLNVIDNLNWYYGGGAHVGFYKAGSGIGIDGILGLDYKFNGAPINISLDWQPSFEFGANLDNGFVGNWGGLSVRYVLK